MTHIYISVFMYVYPASYMLTINSSQYSLVAHTMFLLRKFLKKSIKSTYLSLQDLYIFSLDKFPLFVLGCLTFKKKLLEESVPLLVVVLVYFLCSFDTWELCRTITRNTVFW